MENLKKMKECLIGVAEGQVYGNLDKVNAQELGEVMDMIKDLSEAVYYCTITESMEKQAWEEQESMYYTPYMYNQGAPDGGRAPMYKDNRGGMIRRYDDGQTSYSMYHDRDAGMYPGQREPMIPAPYVYRDGMMRDPSHAMMRDPKEGRSGERRRMYMDGKGHKDKVKQMQELEQYMQELATDITEMIQDASPEEKQLMQNRIATLAAKVK